MTNSLDDDCFIIFNCLGRGRTTTWDEQRLSRPKDAIAALQVGDVHAMVVHYNRNTIQHIAYTAGKGFGLVKFILSGVLHIRKYGKMVSKNIDTRLKAG